MKQHETLFRPVIAPSPDGLKITQGNCTIRIPDCEVELFLSDLSETRRRQLIADCSRIVEPFRGR